jgi:hypothetical protein
MIRFVVLPPPSIVATQQKPFQAIPLTAFPPFPAKLDPEEETVHTSPSYEYIIFEPDELPPANHIVPFQVIIVKPTNGEEGFVYHVIPS